jgi:predicted Rossmann fold flavoprotein
MESYDLIVIGGGAAGFFGAITCAAAQPGMRILALEKGDRLLRKVLVSGGGRCNLTHALFDPAQLAAYYPRGGKALRQLFERFQPRHTMRWFEQRGVAIKTEADGRMFPVTDSAQTIAGALVGEAQRLGITIEQRAAVSAVEREESGFLVVQSRSEARLARAVLLATGGDPRGFELARSLGHTIQAPVPSLFTFALRDARLEGLAGVSIPRVRLKLAGSRLQSEGALLLTHWGMSGPAVLKLSAWAARLLHDSGYQANLVINWLPDYNQDSLFQYLLAVQSKAGRKRAGASDPSGHIPQRLWQRLVAAAGIAKEQLWAELARQTINRLANELALGKFTIQGKGEFKEEFVTCGGVTLKEVDFQTMQSRVCPGLYLAGEVLDIDGLTGGFNFQSAWTTAWIAGQAIAKAWAQSAAA